jgi:hypothetical protein
MRWELMEYNRNPMSLLKLKGLAKRIKQPRALSVEELQSLWAHLDEDTRTMSIVDVSLGLRPLPNPPRGDPVSCGPPRAQDPVDCE